jgi:molecular chaperone HtpG
MRLFDLRNFNITSMSKQNPFISGRSSPTTQTRLRTRCTPTGNFPAGLISNASDACDKLRFEALNNAICTGPTQTQVKVSFDKAAKTTIPTAALACQTGEPLTTWAGIAKSDSRLHGQLVWRPENDAQLIGQFAGLLGLYRCRQDHGQPPRWFAGRQGVRWVSEGTGEFDVARASSVQSVAPASYTSRRRARDYLNAWKLGRDQQIF